MSLTQTNKIDKTKRNKLQKVVLYFATFSIILALTCAIYLMINIDEIGWDNPVSASLLASIFFFLFVAFVLIVIGTANIPSFKFNQK
jgi:magnesium-transporting ATPase (P-type)